MAIEDVVEVKSEAQRLQTAAFYVVKRIVCAEIALRKARQRTVIVLRIVEELAADEVGMPCSREAFPSCGDEAVGDNGGRKGQC